MQEWVSQNYANSQFSNQNRQDAISRVLAVQNTARLRARGPVRALKVWRLKLCRISEVCTMVDKPAT